VESKRGKSMVGTVKDHAMRKGWFFGSFMDEPLLQSDLVEVAWQSIPNLEPAPDQRHAHQQTVEINIILQGWMKLSIDDAEHRVEKGQFYVIWPDSIVSDITTSSDAEVLVVRAPSRPDDKVLLPRD
jgi:hypothetical protein